MDKVVFFDNRYEKDVSNMDEFGMIYVENNEILAHYGAPHILTASPYSSGGKIELYDVWEEVKEYFVKADFYVCFKLAVNKPTLERSLKREGIEFPNKPTICVSTLAQTRLEDIPASRVDLLSHFSIDCEGYQHIEVNEAFLSYKILEKLLAIEQPDNLRDLVEHLKNKKRRSAKSFFKGQSDLVPKSEIEYDSMVVAPSDFDNKGFCISGDIEGIERSELKKKLVDLGGIPKTGVTKKLDFLIMGDNSGPSKLKKANILKEAGHSILILSKENLKDII